LVLSALYFKVNKEDDDFYSRKEIPLHKWTHVAVVFDGTLPPQQRKKIYINGKLDRMGRSDSKKIKQFDTDFSIGKLINNNSSHFVGQIDEVRFWNRALESDELTDQMCQVLSGNEAGLVGYWTFDQMDGNVVKNQTAFGGLDARFQNMSDSSLVGTTACSFQEKTAYNAKN